LRLTLVCDLRRQMDPNRQYETWNMFAINYTENSAIARNFPASLATYAFSDEALREILPPDARIGLLALTISP
jgi:hypothetical protein